MIFDTDYIFDTEYIIEMLRKKRYESGSISIITLIETLRGVAEGERSKIKRLLEESFEVLNLDNEVIETYCNIYDELKSEGELIPDADLIIAATAISKNLGLKSKDKHFAGLRKLGLEVVT